jgi:hypothetical protein
MDGRLGKWLEQVRARYPKARFVAVIIFVSQIIALGNGMIDVYSHAQFYVENRQYIMHIADTAIAAFFSPVGAFVTLVLCGGYLFLDNRAHQRHIIPPSTSESGQATVPVQSGVPLPKAIEVGPLILFLEIIKQTMAEVPIKIVSPQGMEDFAAFISRCFVLMGYRVMDNSDTGSYVFFARTFNEMIVVRSRDIASSGIEQAQLSATRGLVAKGLQYLELPVPIHTAEFPNNNRFDYVQVEICGSL